MRPLALVMAFFSWAQAGTIAWTPFFNCSLPPNKDSAYCDISKSFSDRATALVAELTIEEKSGLFMNHATNISRFHQAAYNWWNEALHGVKQGRSVHTTIFPNIITTASSYNTSLFKLLGEMVSTEVRGLANPNPGKHGNTGQGLTLWAPNINVRNLVALEFLFSPILTRVWSCGVQC